MTADGWERVGELFHAATQLSLAERPAFLQEACGADDALRREVEALLEHHEQPASCLDDDAIGALRALWGGVGAAADRDPAIGRRLGPYRLDERIAGGGMGTVFRGSRQDGQLEQTVAIKLLHPWLHAEDLAQRFRTEWQTLADLAHPNIAQVLDAGVTDGTPYLIMEYIDGGSIDDYCDRERLSIERRLELFETIARAVHFAHQNLVVHRDLKPANILVTSGGQPKLLDFGIAKILVPRGAAAAAKSATRTLLMTPYYASPEQLRGEAVTTATDVYSLGVVLYELLTGRCPYVGADAWSAHIDRILAQREPPRPSTAAMPLPYPDDHTATAPSGEELAGCRATTPAGFLRRLRGDLDDIVMKAMHGDPRRRYASAEALADDLRRHLRDEPVMARPDTILYRTRKLIARNRLTSVATALALLAAVAGTVTTAWQARVAKAERDDTRNAYAVAETERDHASSEAVSSRQMVAILSDAFLISAPRRSPEQLERIAELLDRHAFRIRHQYAGEHHERANLLDALGSVYVELDLYDPAAALLDEAMGIRQQQFGSESLETALSHSSQGQLAYRRSDTTRAIEHFRRALDLQLRLPAGVHTDLAHAMNDLAVALRDAGSLDEAEELHERALALRREMNGEDHLTVAESLNNLAAIQAQRGDHARAHDALLRALAIRRACLGERHPLIAQSLNNLAKILHDLGRRNEAVEYMRQSVALYKALPDIEPQAVARALSNLAHALRLSGKLDGARSAARDALQLLRQQTGGEDRPQLAEALQAVAEVAHAMNRTDEAIEHYARALAMRRRMLPAGQRALGTLLANYGTVLVRAKEPGAAEPILKEAIAILIAADPQPAAFLAAAECSLANSLAAEGRFAEAEPLLLAALKRLDGRKEAQWLQTRQRLHRLYTIWGKPERAREYVK